MPERRAGYPRRRFLTQCASIPLAASVAAAADPTAPADGEPPLGPLAVRKMPEADLAREVESLLKLVDPRVLHRHQPLAAEKNAWPLWERAHAASWPDFACNQASGPGMYTDVY